jgi:ribosomal protein S18 acetylase RimI-like enzyme
MKSFQNPVGQTKESLISLRTEPCIGDRQAVKKILSSTHLFYSCEIDIAIWLLNEGIRDGNESGYYFLFADKGKETVGYICYGPITLTENRFDLYWIAVRKDFQGNGLGGLLIREGEKKIRELGGRIVYVETSSRKDYWPTLAFYKKHRYLEIARIPDFYRDGDDKIILMKRLP